MASFDTHVDGLLDGLQTEVNIVLKRDKSTFIFHCLCLSYLFQGQSRVHIENVCFNYSVIQTSIRLFGAHQKSRFRVVVKEESSRFSGSVQMLSEPKTQD